MSRFKFGRKKKDHGAEVSIHSTETAEEEPAHSYLRRPSISSKDRSALSSGLDTTSQSQHYASGIDTNGSHNNVSNIAAKNDNFPVANKNQLAGSEATTPWKRHKLFNSPFPRYRHAASTISSEKNEIFLMGGLKEGSVFGDTWKIVPQVSASGLEIEALVAEHVDVANANDPPARVGHASVLCGNAYIIYGGDTVDTDISGNPDDNFYMFNINNHKYTIPSHILNKPSGRYGHSLGAVSSGSSSSRLYLFGGQLEDTVYDDLYYFELTSFKSPEARWELVEPKYGFKPPPLTNHSMSVFKSKIYIFGGVYNNEKVSNDLWCFDTISNKWSKVPTEGACPPPMNEHSTCIVSDNLFVYGGNDFAGAIYDTLHCLNLHSLKWTTLKKESAAHGPGSRCGHTMTYLPKLNKLLIMGGDKNDYVYAQASNFDTYEEFDGEEVGTMIYELDIGIAHSLMSGSQPRKVAASAGGGAAGVLSRRAASPSPSEDAMTRHRRSLSAGVEDFQTPHGSVEGFGKSLDPQRDAIHSPLPEPHFHNQFGGMIGDEFGNKFGDKFGDNLKANFGDSLDDKLGEGLSNEYEEKLRDKFVDVNVSSSATSIDAAKGLNEKEHGYSNARTRPKQLEPENFATESPEEGIANSGTSDFIRNFESETASPDSSPFQGTSFGRVRSRTVFSGIVSEPRDETTLSVNGQNGRLDKSPALDTKTEFGTGAIAQVHEGVALSQTPLKNSEVHDFGAKRAVSNASTKAPAIDPKNDPEVKKMVQKLAEELSSLKVSAKSEMEAANAQIESLEMEKRDLQQKQEAIFLQQQDHVKAIAEKDTIINELRSAVDPEVLSVSSVHSQNEQGSRNGLTDSTLQKGFTELTKYKLERMDLMNRLAYLENDNSQLREKHTHFEPFMNNQVEELSVLQKVIRGQEEKIKALTSQVKSESVLQKEITYWKHKFEDLELEFNTYRSINSEISISDDEFEASENARALENGSSVATPKMKTTSDISAKLESLVTLWQQSTSHIESSRSVEPQDTPLVKQLQSQIDDLLSTSQAQQKGSSAEISALQGELQAKLDALKTFELNYRDALQSVKNTSKALDLTQDELASQKLAIERLQKDNNELRLFKKAAAASRKHSFQVADPALANGISNGPATVPVYNEDDDDEEEFTAAHYNVKLKDLEADLYIMKQDRDQLNDQVAALKKELYLVRS